MAIVVSISPMAFFVQKFWAQLFGTYYASTFFDARILAQKPKKCW
jgi:hypothetical protein